MPLWLHNIDDISKLHVFLATGYNDDTKNIILGIPAAIFATTSIPRVINNYGSRNFDNKEDEQCNCFSFNFTFLRDVIILPKAGLLVPI
jgi:hypothetical protein